MQPPATFVSNDVHTFSCDIPVVFNRLNTKNITSSQNTTKFIALCCAVCYTTQCKKVRKTQMTQTGKFILQTMETLLVIIVPRYTKHRTGKHTVYVYSDGIELQQAQEP